jgi:hypothetical protein
MIMTRSMLGRTAFAGVVALALGFGVREAVAAPGQAREDRPYCRDGQHCQEICDAAYPNSAPIGECYNNTCWCYY